MPHADVTFGGDIFRFTTSNEGVTCSRRAPDGQFLDIPVEEVPEKLRTRWVSSLEMRSVTPNFAGRGLQIMPKGAPSNDDTKPSWHRSRRRRSGLDR